MKTSKQTFDFRRTILALSVLMVFGVAYAEDEEVEKLTKNESTISMGAGVATGDFKSRSIFSQYNGYNSIINNDINPLIDFNVIKLKEASGLWVKLEGHNLAQDNREVNFSINKQGDWKYSFDYNEITHHEIRTINTALQGAGTTTPVVTSLATAGSGADINLQLQRKAASVSAEKWITPNLMFEATFKNEDKTGARLSGEGIYCGSWSRYSCNNYAGAILLLPEPVNTNIKQIDAKLNLSGDKFLLSSGYYGSFFSNTNGSVNPIVNTAGFTTAPPLASFLQAPIAQTPDNQAHQFYISGNYAFTPTAQSNFKYVYTHATQDENFSSMGLTGGPAGVSNLGGVVDTKLAQFGLKARPLSKLTVVANVRYEDKNDKTPSASYNLLSSPFTTPPPSAYYSNDYSSSSKKITGKFDTAYQLPDRYRATLGVDYASVQRAAPPTSIGAASDLGLAIGGLRENTREVGYRAELRRSFTDTYNMAVILGHSQRTGDSWVFYSGNGSGSISSSPLNVNGTLPMTMMDRKRDKVKVSADWMATSKLSLQLNLEHGKDTYTGPIEVGMRDTGMSSYGVDAAYVISDNWKLTGYVSQSDQTLHVNHMTTYQAELVDSNTSVGLGVIGKPTSRVDVGGNVSYMNDKNSYKQTGTGLPDAIYHATNLKLYSKYSLQKNADVRLDLVYQNATLDEWTWGSNFAYSDKTTVTVQPHQCVTFIGASYIYKLR
jgi:MtrB/PioB family decaheme-associated outer membrane protein